MTRPAFMNTDVQNKATTLLKRPYGPWEVFYYQVSDGYPPGE